MLKKIQCVIILLLIAATGFSQSTWFKVYGGNQDDTGLDIKQTNDGGYVVIGRTAYIDATTDVYLIKADSMGNLLWSRTYGGEESDRGYSICQTTDLGYIIIGSTRLSGTTNVFLIKTDALGDTIWTRTYGEGIGIAGQQCSDGGYIITGHNYNDNGILIKIDVSGDKLWTKQFQTEVLYRGYDIQQTTDGGYIITGVAKGFFALVKTDSLGTLQWANRYEATYGYSVRQTFDGGYIATGETYVPGGGESSRQMILLKTNASGDTLWTRRLGDTHSGGNCVRQTVDGGYIITGFFDMDYICLIRTDERGNSLWQKIFGYGDGNSISPIEEGFVFTGKVKLNGKIDYDIFLIKTDPYGLITEIENPQYDKKQLPQNFKLYQNHPNPFNHTTLIQYEVVGKDQNCKIVIYDIAGKVIKSILRSHQNPGTYQIEWNGKNTDGTHVASGIYFYQIEVDGQVKAANKLLVIR